MQSFETPHSGSPDKHKNRPPMRSPDDTDQFPSKAELSADDTLKDLPPSPDRRGQQYAYADWVNVEGQMQAIESRMKSAFEGREEKLTDILTDLEDILHDLHGMVAEAHLNGSSRKALDNLNAEIVKAEKLRSIFDADIPKEEYLKRQQEASTEVEPMRDTMPTIPDDGLDHIRQDQLEDLRDKIIEQYGIDPEASEAKDLTLSNRFKHWFSKLSKKGSMLDQYAEMKRTGMSIEEKRALKKEIPMGGSGSFAKEERKAASARSKNKLPPEISTKGDLAEIAEAAKYTARNALKTPKLAAKELAGSLKEFHQDLQIPVNEIPEILTATPGRARRVDQTRALLDAEEAHDLANGESYADPELQAQRTKEDAQWRELLDENSDFHIAPSAEAVDSLKTFEAANEHVRIPEKPRATSRKPTKRQIAEEPSVMLAPEVQEDVKVMQKAEMVPGRTAMIRKMAREAAYEKRVKQTEDMMPPTFEQSVDKELERVDLRGSDKTTAEILAEGAELIAKANAEDAAKPKMKKERPTEIKAEDVLDIPIDVEGEEPVVEGKKRELGRRDKEQLEKVELRRLATEKSAMTVDKVKELNAKLGLLPDAEQLWNKAFEGFQGMTGAEQVHAALATEYVLAMGRLAAGEKAGLSNKDLVALQLDVEKSWAAARSVPVEAIDPKAAKRSAKKQVGGMQNAYLGFSPDLGFAPHEKGVRILPGKLMDDMELAPVAEGQKAAWVVPPDSLNLSKTYPKRIREKGPPDAEAAGFNAIREYALIPTIDAYIKREDGTWARSLTHRRVNNASGSVQVSFMDTESGKKYTQNVKMADFLAWQKEGRAEEAPIMEVSVDELLPVSEAKPDMATRIAERDARRAKRAERRQGRIEEQEVVDTYVADAAAERERATKDVLTEYATGEKPIDATALALLDDKLGPFLSQPELHAYTAMQQAGKLEEANEYLHSLARIGAAKAAGMGKEYQNFLQQSVEPIYTELLKQQGKERRAARGKK